MSLSIEEINQLRLYTLEARDLAYAPYSKFKVGATILTEDNVWIKGANVENASYGAGICAERTAIVKAITEKHTKFKAIGVATYSENACSPCGICRQFSDRSIREFAPNVNIYMFNCNGDYEVMTLQQLLPMSFGPEDLEGFK